MAFQEGDRVCLIDDYMNEEGYHYWKGQLGTVYSRIETDGKQLVDFDGYDRERESDRIAKERDGEGANIVPWFSVIPVELLKYDSSGD